MNERILKFAEAAGWDIAEIMKIQNAQKMQKFAELIVQECANFIEPLGDYCGGHGEPREPSTRECAEKLKQHFGIN